MKQNDHSSIRICSPRSGALRRNPWLSSLRTGARILVLASGLWSVGLLSARSGALSFDGEEHVEVPHDDSLNVSRITIEAWVNIDLSDGTHRRILHRSHDQEGEPAYLYSLWTRSNRVGFGLNIGNRLRTVEGDLPPLGDWVHVAGSYDGARLLLYVNGEVVGQNSGHRGPDIVGNSLPLRIGNNPDGNEGFAGRICEVRLWDHARQISRIRGYMQRRLTGTETGLVAYWPMDDTDPGTLLDRTSHENHGDISGATRVPSGLDFHRFCLADRRTGSLRFTGADAVDVAYLAAPPGFDHFQVVAGADLPSGPWVSLSDPHDPIPFMPPASDQDVLFTAWFTNLTESTAMDSAVRRIHYTTALPNPVVRAALTRTTPGASMRITGADIDAGSDGGEADGRSMAVFDLQALCVANPAADATPDAPFVTLTNTADHAVSLRVINEAGNAAISVSHCLVSVLSAVDPPTTGDRYVSAHNIFAQAPFTSWRTAAATLQDAIDDPMTTAGDIILAWDGVYDAGGRPQGASGFSNRVHLASGLILRSASDDPAAAVIVGQRDLEAADDMYNPEDQDGNDGWGPGAVRGVFMETDSRLIGFTVRDGATHDAGAASELRHGAGIHAVDNTAIVSNCVITANTAASFGGGGYRGTYHDCRIEGNHAMSRGGGVCDAIIHNCQVMENFTGTLHAYGGGSGGGIYNTTAHDSLVAGNATGSWGGGVHGGLVVNTVISNNTAWGGGGTGGTGTTLEGCLLVDNEARYGGGMMQGTATDTIFLRNRASGAIGGGGAHRAVSLTRCVFIENETNRGDGGGGVLGRYTDGGSGWSVDTVVRNSIFIGNRSTHSTGGTGGGVAGVRIYNSLLFGNEASVRGGGAYDSILYNCTVVGNTAGDVGGGVHGSDTTDHLGALYAAVTNSIVIDNISGNGGANYDGLVHFGYSLSDPIPDGPLNLTGDPNFVDPAATNFRLRVQSQLAINRGRVFPWMTDENDPASKDLDGNARLIDHAADLGAYEYPEVLPRGSLLMLR